MADYSVNELKKWSRQIEEIAEESGLDCYEQEFWLVSYEEMMSYEAYSGMPSHYPHWSYGKAYERIRTLNKYNLSGLPYEIVINSNPCIAYLMKDNSLLLQILTMAHVYAHNDFFKNNRLFRLGTRAEHTVEMFKNHAERVRDYVKDPSIGCIEVERVLNAAHALRYQCERIIGIKKLQADELRERVKSSNKRSASDFPLLEPKPTYTDEPDLRRLPLEPEEDLLFFISTYGRLEPWQKDIIDIVREETRYFIPQIETKIINEGWASFWHYMILKKLGLPQKLYFEFLRRHNQIIKPYEGRINPYFLGFKIFMDLYEKNDGNTQKIFEVRSVERDETFIRRYLTKELCAELKLFEYEKHGSEYVVSEVADDKGWMKIRNTIASSTGFGSLPVVRVIDWNQKENTLLLEHMYDGRELDLQYANETLKHLVDLWEGRVILNTVAEGKKKSIMCDEQRKIVIINT
ncbi:MAG: SpoVR family protein [Acetivibrionales bacterium]|jgi:stage V sporulation protein R|nr:SpoVR family protein [Clostridiaceae bacterium]HOA54088.1 SpoVR family protein [Clostridiales bacterium]HQD30985.1 SpoVR family protein [Clostridiales bacterium]